MTTDLIKRAIADVNADSKRVLDLNDQVRELAQRLDLDDRGFDVLREYVSSVIEECSAVAWWAEQYDIGDGVAISKQIKQRYGVE